MVKNKRPPSKAGIGRTFIIAKLKLIKAINKIRLLIPWLDDATMASTVATGPPTEFFASSPLPLNKLDIV